MQEIFCGIFFLIIVMTCSNKDTFYRQSGHSPRQSMGSVCSGSAQRILSCFFLVNMLRMYILAAFASFQKYVMMP